MISGASPEESQVINQFISKNESFKDDTVKWTLPHLLNDGIPVMFSHIHLVYYIQTMQLCD